MTNSTKEAMEYLAANRGREIEWGKYFAIKIAKQNSTVHSREVRAEIEKTGLLDPEKSEHWLGTVFQKLRDEGFIKWSGHYYKYRDRERNIHNREVKLWMIIDENKATPYDKPPVAK